MYPLDSKRRMASAKSHSGGGLRFRPPAASHIRSEISCMILLFMVYPFAVSRVDFSRPQLDKPGLVVVRQRALPATFHIAPPLLKAECQIRLTGPCWASPGMHTGRRMIAPVGSAGAAGETLADSSSGAGDRLPFPLCSLHARS